MNVRTRARSWVLQILYAWDLSPEGQSLGTFARRELEGRAVAGRYRPHIDRLLEVIEERFQDLDGVLESSMLNWRIDRLDTIDRNILRIGVTEILYLDDVPPKVAMSEAIRLAEKYGSGESPRFVNGVLDAVCRRAAVIG